MDQVSHLDRLEQFSAVPRDDYAPPARFCATAYMAIEAATPAFKDSKDELIGTETSWSQVSETSRPRPLPSDPTTITNGPSARSRSGSATSPSAARPITMQPAFWYSFSSRTRFTACATGTRA